MHKKKQIDATVLADGDYRPKEFSSVPRELKDSADGSSRKI